MKKIFKFMAYILLMLAIAIVILLSVLNIVRTSKDPSLDIDTFSLFFSVFTFVGIQIAFLIDRHDNNKDKLKERKAKIISSVTPNDIETKIEALYKNELQGKAIDKIEIVNTLTDHSNENRKDVIIIYH